MKGSMVRSWWRDAVIYQVYPRSFADSDGDGIGDLNGVRERLPYLRDLGVDAVWLSPFYTSPQADGGYDVADYRAVDPTLGTLADAEALIAEAHGLGLRVLVDIVPNHSSDRHPWFLDAIAGGACRDRYHFRPGRDGGPPNDWQSLFGGPAWTQTPAGDWYLHLFAPEQPDFNWDHPAVAAEFRSVLRFWLDRGVDGVRVDVAHGLVKAHGLPDHGVRSQLLDLAGAPFWDQDEVHGIYCDWRGILDEYEAVGVAEAWGPTLARTANYVRPGELHQAFNFHHLTSAWDPVVQRTVIDESLAAMRAVGAPATWVLSNHDVVRHPTRLSPDASPAAALRRGRAATLLMLALPGSAYLYQGEELGLPEVLDLPDDVRRDPAFARTAGEEGFRDGCRVPIPWHGDEPPYGFTRPGTRTWLPQPSSWAALSVDAQTGSPGSTLEMYRAALALRRTHLASDHLRWVSDPGSGVLHFERRTNDTVLSCATNFGDRPACVGITGELLLTSAPVRQEGSSVLIGPDTTVWWSACAGSWPASAAPATTIAC